MTQIWPGFGVAPVPTVLSMICKPDAVVMVFPAVWADAPDGARSRMRWAACSIAERATVLAWIGAAGERALFPIDPDRLTAAERGDDAGGLMPKLPQALDDIGGGAVLELI